jgi:thiol-disulfide isomerase/thioredoxin
MATTVQLPVEGHLPSFDGATGWINTGPLTPADLRGRPVLVEFWTFTCINWLRTLPYVRAWFEKYRAEGLVVLGVHTPEFDVEQDTEHVRRAAQEMRIDFPIAVDSDYRVWRAFDNNYWPALYFADADGQIRHHRYGEGDYDHSEMVIRRLLAAAGAENLGPELGSVDGPGIEAAADWDHLRSGEAYIGYRRAEGFASPGGVARDRPREYAMPDELRLNEWALTGDWTVGGQPAVLNAAGGGITHHFHARDLHLVLAPPPDDRPVRFTVRLDGAAPGADHGVDIDEHGEGTVIEPRLYQLIRQRGRIADRTFEITFPDAGVRAYVFTFG